MLGAVEFLFLSIAGELLCYYSDCNKYDYYYYYYYNYFSYINLLTAKVDRVLNEFSIASPLKIEDADNCLFSLNFFSEWDIYCR